MSFAVGGSEIRFCNLVGSVELSLNAAKNQFVTTAFNQFLEFLLGNRFAKST